MERSKPEAVDEDGEELYRLASKYCTVTEIETRRDETYTGKTAIGEIHTDGKQNKEPGLRIHDRLSGLIPSEFPVIQETGFVL